jgi:enterochelin esterase-like enzyme
LNRRPPRPKRGALANCATPRGNEYNAKLLQSSSRRTMRMPFGRKLLLLAFVLGLSACAPLNGPDSQPTASPAPPLPTASPTPAPPTPLACLVQPGTLAKVSLTEYRPPQEFIVYTPPCYQQQRDQRFPVLYLLHGQTYNDDQWIRLGTPVIADNLIASGEAPPFIIVFPDDRYWNLPAGTGFGQRLVEAIIPYVDTHYRTIDVRPGRAIGGLSRGGGWALQVGLTHWDMFDSIGLHSPAIFGEDRPQLETWVKDIPSNAWPRLYLDIGDNDTELGFALKFDDLLTQYDVPHEWHLYTGDHTESYWGAHVEEYLRWYAAGWTTNP